MRQYLTTTELTGLLAIAENTNSGKKEYAEVYQTLYDKGFNYAGWGKGVVTKETVTGVSAVNFMNTTSPTGEALTQAQELKVNKEMVTGYLKTLLQYAVDNGGQTNREVSYKDLFEFHKDGFYNVIVGHDGNGSAIRLDVEKNWTLHVPMEVLKKQYF